MDDQPSTLGAGSRLGRYKIRSRIGAGGMGEVFLAEDTTLDRQVALKVLPADVTTDPDRMQRFTREAKAASALNHFWITGAGRPSRRSIRSRISDWLARRFSRATPPRAARRIRTSSRCGRMRTPIYRC